MTPNWWVSLLIGSMQNSVVFGMPHVGGAASPLIQNGRLFQFHTRPATGTLLQPSIAQDYAQTSHALHGKVTRYAQGTGRTDAQVFCAGGQHTPMNT